MKLIGLFLFTLVAYILFDQIWINGFAKGFIERQVGNLLATKPDLIAGILFYLLFAGGLCYFCILPALEENDVKKALVSGAFFGLVTYGTYELVNKALIDKWPWQLTLIDMGWGLLAGAVVSWLGFLVAGKWLLR
jgi:uncharacterized membrane protein